MKHRSIIPLMRPLMPDLGLAFGLIEARKDRSSWTNFGELYQQAELEISKITGHPSVIVANGTVAIQLAIMLHCPPGSRVAVPDFTHPATLQAVLAANCMPVIFPVNNQTWQIDPMVLQEKRAEFDAFIVVSPFGYPVNVRAYDELADLMKKKVVYDFAAAWGMFPITKWPITYSLHTTKNFSCGEGGVVCLNSEDQQNYVRKMTNFNTLPDRKVAHPFGGNYKIDEIRSAMILSHVIEIEQINARIECKRETLHKYQTELSDLGLWAPVKQDEGAPSLCTLMGFNDVAHISSELKIKRIEHKQYYIPLTTMQGLSQIPRVRQSGKRFQTCLALPSDVSEFEASCVVSAIREAVRNK